MSLHPESDLDFCSADAELLGSYELVSELAAGHLTTLHRAHPQGVSEPPLVIKRLRYQHVHESADRALLLAAGRAGMRVRSPHVVRVLAVHEDPEPFVVMEHLDGVSLSAILDETLEEEVLRYAFPLLVDVLMGLSALHGDADSGLVHGAPCARHVLVGRDGIARLIDLTHATGKGFRLAAHRSLRLHPSEMAPEQVLAPAHVDARCDLFIVGTVLYRALTGRSLFDADNRDEALRQLLVSEPIVAPSKLGSAAGSRFDAICMRALARTRSERFGSAREMAEALREEAMRADLYASREEIASLVRMLSCSAQDYAELTPALDAVATPEVVAKVTPSVEARPRAREPRPEESGIAPDDKSKYGWVSLARAGLRELAPAVEAGGSVREPNPVIRPIHAVHGPRADASTHDSTPRVGSADITLTEAIASSPGTQREDSGTWFEGLPSIVPTIEEPRDSATPYWVWGIAAAAALTCSVFIDRPPWTAQHRLRAASTTPVKAARREPARPGAAADVVGFQGYFAVPRSTVASSALPPRGERAQPETCEPKPVEVREQDREPAARLAAREQVKERTKAARPLARAAKPVLLGGEVSELPPNPFSELPSNPY